ncbi:DNA polymerase beta superfamily protein [Myxosarcina sp. GI1]|uniref:nucleotidyltransferase domain-containing protein n=1 Tax=Myxosarcina sp. GI1 TaxID=1541065 RepID=UPI0005620E9D|nr:nucleotidyltransferase domain-containing protein [Myxosarcina sp. GI1]
MLTRIDKLKKISSSQPYTLLFATISGAHLYGFPSSDSDYDLRGSHILPVAEVISLYPVRETIEISKTEANLELDLVTHDVKKFLLLLLKRNGYVLEQLYSPLVVHTTAAHKELKAIAANCITRHHSYHYLGFAKTQRRLFEKSTIKKIKPLLYIYRVLLTGIYLMNTGIIEANLVKLNQEFKISYLSDLIAIKTEGKEKSILESDNVDFYLQECDRLLAELETAAANSHLPDSPSEATKAKLNDLLVEARIKCA